MSNFKEGLDTNTKLGNEIGGSGSFMQTIMPTMPAISTSGEFYIMSSGDDCGFFSNKAPSQADINFPYLLQEKYERKEIPSGKELTMPPTPNSANIHGKNTATYTQSDYQLLHPATDGIKLHGNDQEVGFTPLASPAVSPLEYQFNALGYSFADSYLSPLSSPALQAQNDFSPLYDQPSSWVTNSPVLNNECITFNEFPASRTHNFDDKISKMQSRNSFRVKKSPVVNQNRGMRGSNSFSQSLDGMDLSYLPNGNFKSNPYASLTLGETPDDCSNLSEKLPSLPPNLFLAHDSVNLSPDLNTEDSNYISCTFASDKPATPASLMKITQLSMHTPKLEPTKTHNQSSVNSREVFLKPLNSQEAKSQIESSLNTVSNIIESESLPMRLPIKKKSNTVSIRQSPKDEYPGTNAASLRKSQFGTRNHKSRNSTLNVISPALLPRLSPNLKPLINSGGKELENSASLILASKSNYQNILDGTYFPGITYSPELSANLTSKRTSHKIAEQGRRNRMNSALQEMASLLPYDQNKNRRCEKNKNGETVGSEKSIKGISQNMNSKARTVERAISYIRHLKSQLEIAIEKLEEIETNKKL
ncbi:Phosphorus acquisition-controlling protein [Erysiphe necator]|nr:Phosphorus acquisition-controlling protein [Erysiphe necator]